MRTGETRAVLDKTKNAEEILWSGGLLLVRRREKIPDYPPGASAWSLHSNIAPDFLLYVSSPSAKRLRRAPS